MLDNPLYIREESKKRLTLGLWNDTVFLSKVNVMDYSLLVGVDSTNNELLVGVIDYLRYVAWVFCSWVLARAF